MSLKQALFYNQKDKGVLCCSLCNHHCLIKEGTAGRCRVRKNIKGVLYSANYGQLAAEAVDPIEKKPLFHFFPGSRAYSVACLGCNFSCDFCQNWQISQANSLARPGPQPEVSAAQVVARARRHKCQTIAYTYSEPTVYFEFAADCARQARSAGLYNIFVTNGYMSQAALRQIAPDLDAANVDLKSFRPEFYQTRCQAHLAPVLENIALMKELGIWVEITTLVIPGHNDSPQELADIAGFIASLDKDIPWHISRFSPTYKLTEPPPTPLATLEQAYKIGKAQGLNFIYLGNIYSDYGENTYCPACSQVVIQRSGFLVEQNHIKDGKCAFCSQALSGRW